MSTNLAVELTHWFCDLATQYYVAGRLAARGGLVPVHGNLFHHAIEMYLKATLVGTVTMPQMKQTYGHNLVKLWSAYKAQQHAPVLGRFDKTITALHRFESIRYPDAIVTRGMLTGVVWTRGGVKIPNAKKNPRRPEPKYEVVIAEVDELVIEILDRAGRNPKVFVLSISGDARAALSYQNPTSARWA